MCLRTCGEEEGEGEERVRRMGARHGKIKRLDEEGRGDIMICN